MLRCTESTRGCSCACLLRCVRPPERPADRPRSCRDPGARYVELIGVTLRNVPIEDFHREIGETRMRHPGAIVTVGRFERFVGADFRGDDFVLLRILARNERGHTAHRERAATMAGANQQSRIRAEERLVHRQRLPIGQHAIGVFTQCFDVAEDVVPASAVERHRVVAQARTGSRPSEMQRATSRSGTSP